MPMHTFAHETNDNHADRIMLQKNEWRAFTGKVLQCGPEASALREKRSHFEVITLSMCAAGCGISAALKVPIESGTLHNGSDELLPAQRLARLSESC